MCIYIDACYVLGNIYGCFEVLGCQFNLHPLLTICRTEDHGLAPKWTFDAHQLGVVSVATDPTGQSKQSVYILSSTHLTPPTHWHLVAASSGLDGYIKLWDLESGKLLKSIDGGPGEACPESV